MWLAQVRTFLTITAQTYRHKHKLLCRGGWAVRTCHDYTLQQATDILFYCAIPNGIHVTYCITRNSLWPKNLDGNKNMSGLVKTWFRLHKKHFVIKMWSSFFSHTISINMNFETTGHLILIIACSVCLNMMMIPLLMSR